MKGNEWVANGEEKKLKKKTQTKMIDFAFI